MADLVAAPLGHMPQFGAAHGMILLLAVVLAVTAVPLARRKPEILPVLGWILLGYTIFWDLWAFLPGHYTLEQSWPLHFSDALRIVSAVALITRARWAVSITMLWGLTINLMSIITPDLNYENVLWLEFFSYWFLHIGVLLAALMLLALGEKPSVDGSVIATAFAIGWGLIALVFNHFTGANYGYMSRPPGNASILDLFGGWPFYIIAEVLILAVVWTVLANIIDRARIPYVPKVRKGTENPSPSASVSGMNSSGTG